MVTLRAPAFQPLPISSITARGWLARQLRIQADGLSGHLDDFWTDIVSSAWIGGNADGWERMPYWLDGVIPLAWHLNDTAMKRRITGYLDYIITHQCEDGWLGPRPEQHARASDLWSQILAIKMLMVYHDACGDHRAAVAARKALQKLDRQIDANPLSTWGQFRWFEALLPIWWLYTKEPEQWLVDLAVELHAQGFDWLSFFRRWPYRGPTPKGRWNYAGHVVNNAMAIKCAPLWWRLTGDDADKNGAAFMIDQLDKYHGMVTGVFSGDECIAGTSPIQGTELCAVVEYMYSLETLLSVLGDASLADRLERIAFNALPATFSPDMWSHQYDQQVNQIECSVRENRTWNSNGPDANTFGLEPNYGCCTANLSQGWPKFVSHLWMRTRDNGLAAVAYAPSRVVTEIDGVAVSVTLDTDYPFGEELRFTVAAAQPVSFPLLLRIPAWTKAPRLCIGAKQIAVDSAGAYHRIERRWEGETVVSLTLPMHPQVHHRTRDAVAISRGPLVYSLPVGESWKQINTDKADRQPPHADWEVLPTTPWNYALCISEQTLDKDVVYHTRQIGECPFSPGEAPAALTVKGRQVPQWEAENGSAQEVPMQPFQCDSATVDLTLIPYGCTNLRVTEFPCTQSSG